MIFGSVPVAGAAGAILAHTHRLPGRVLKKGALLDEAALTALTQAGIAEVIAARLEPGDEAEDPAARRVADALLGPGLRATRAATGRVNLEAVFPGLLRVSRQRIDALNGVDESVTVATLGDATPVMAGEMLATIKIIPFAVPSTVLDRAIAAGQGAMAVHSWQPRRVGLVLTTLPGLKPSVITGTIAATATRIASIGSTLLPPLQCAHRTAPIAASLQSLLDQGADLLLIAGASAVVDRRDVGPAGIVAAGGTIEHFGMPVDPGNLICLGRIGNVPALVLPGCARSPKLNGIDLVLHRLGAGLPVAGATVAGLGVGGLLKDITARPLPRARATGPAPVHPGKQVAAIVLAAGKSSRMAPQHKLLATGRDGLPMVAHVVDRVLASRAHPVLVVTGHRESELQAALADRPVTFVTAHDYADGLSASLRAGLRAVPQAAAAAIVVLGDMPLVEPATIDRLIATYDADEGRLIVVPTYQGAPGNPILWDRRFFSAMAALTGDRGARALLTQHADSVAEIEAGEAVLRDFDTAASLAEWVHPDTVS